MTDRLSIVRRSLEAHHQAHILAFYDELKPAQQKNLLDQIVQIDLVALDRLINEYVRQKPSINLPQHLEPAPFYRNTEKFADLKKWRLLGEDLIRAGKFAAFTVAGGQGTRLGWDGPKGTFPATVVTGKPLFRVFAEQILATQRKYAVARNIPWYIMTSPINDADTQSFFADNNYFGLNRRDVFMFPQGVLPSIEASTGKLLLAEKHEIAVNPDGHGGSINALCTSGAIEDMVARGVEHISYFQVDNPLVKCIDPLFIGLHAAAPDSSAEFSSKMVAKANAAEKVGVFCRDQSGDGKTLVIEYSDLPADIAGQLDEHGHLRFIAGNIAVHIIGVKFVQRLTQDSATFGLPFHRAHKKVPYVDTNTGKKIEPDQPNAVKLEAFIFDAIPLAEKSIILETSRVEEFGPIKNATGVDSVETSHQTQSDRHGNWLSKHGVQIPLSDGHLAAKIEINPLTALEADDLASVKLPKSIAIGQEIVI